MGDRAYPSTWYAGLPVRGCWVGGVRQWDPILGNWNRGVEAHFSITWPSLVSYFFVLVVRPR